MSEVRHDRTAMTMDRPNPPARVEQSRRIYATLLILIVLGGIVCRARQYLARTSFWNDEAFVVLNLEDHSYPQLLGPLDYDQAAPPAFLWVEKLASQIFGPGEYSLRLFPLLSGLAALALFAVLAWRVLPPPVAVFAVGWFAFLQKLIEYCAEVKQYSSDALVAVMLLLAGLAMGKTWSCGRRMLTLSVLAAAAVWLSHPAAIVLGALSIMLLPACIGGGWRDRLAWIAGNGLVMISFYALYRLSIVREQSRFLYTFWAAGFPPVGHPEQIAVWFGRQMLEWFRQPAPPVALVTGLLAVLGTAALVIERKWRLMAACLLPVGLTIIAAFARKYPFAPSRLTLYLLPGLVLLCGAGAQWLAERLPSRIQRGWLVLPLILLGVGVATAAGRVIHPHFRSHIRPAVQYVRAHRRPGDAIFLLGEPPQGVPVGTPTRHLEFFCYWRDPAGPVSQTFPRPDQLPSRFWIVFPFTPAHGTRFAEPALSAARSVATEQGEPLILNEGGAAYLFVRRQP